MGLKILHSADWHLDAPFGGFTQEQREALRREQLLLPDKIVSLAQREKCDLILLAGDLFDGQPSPQTVEQVRRALGGCGIRVLIAPGNHDFYGPDSVWQQERWPDNVYIFKSGLSSFTHIMKALIEVLKEKFSMSAVTFLMSLWIDFRLSAVGSPSVTMNSSPL